MPIVGWDDGESRPSIIMQVKSIPLEQHRWNIIMESPATRWKYSGSGPLIIMLLFFPFNYNIPLYYIAQFHYIGQAYYNISLYCSITI
jgi:hypothetical protein